MRQYVGRLLAERYRVEAVPDGEAALAAAREQPPDLILTDVMMPRLDGFGLLRDCGPTRAPASVPVIMLSARAGEESRVEGMEAGADDYLVKPFSARELLARVGGAPCRSIGCGESPSEAIRQSEERERRLLTRSGDGERAIPSVLRAGVALRRHHGCWTARSSSQPTLPGGVRVHEGRSRSASRSGTVPGGARRRHSWQSRSRRRPPGRGGELSRSGPNRRTSWPTARERMVDLIIAARSRTTSGRVVFLAPTGTDITDRKRAEEALKDADRRKDEFLATLAHELRNPLAPLRNGLQIMRLAQGRPARPSSRPATMMERQLGQMVRLIDDLLDLSRISRGKIELRKERGRAGAR